MVAQFQTDRPVFVQVPCNAETGFDFTLGFVKILRPLSSMSEIKGPLPFTIPLPQNDLLLHFGFFTRITRLQIQRQANSVFGRVEHQVTILQRDSTETERGDVSSGRGIAVALGGFIQIKFHGVTVAHAILPRLAEFPLIEIVLADGLRPLCPQRDPLFKLCRTLRHRFRFVSVGKTALVRLRFGQAQTTSQ